MRHFRIAPWVRHWRTFFLFLVPFCLYLYGLAAPHVPEFAQHILLTLTAVMGIHVLDRLFLIKDSEGAFQKLIEGVRLDIAQQTSSLLHTSKSLEAMERCGIVHIYPTRRDAAQDIGKDLGNASNTQIKIIGISLNDFVQGIDPVLADVWRTIQAYVRGQKRVQNDKLDIKILIIDPTCFGAKLRSESECQAQSALAERLGTDVHAAAKELLDLQEEATRRGTSTGVSFECKLYRLPPMLFLSWVDSACYVQQYHFWSARDNRTPVPVFRFRRLVESHDVYPYHSEMEHHFKWIWENASVPVRDYLALAVVGTDEGLNQCGAINIFTNPKMASSRIAGLLADARDKVSIQGVSLHSFFTPGKLFEAFCNLLERGQAEVEILLLDPESSQAKYRSYRERLFVSGEQTYQEYVALGRHESSDLYRDTYRTMENIKNAVDDIVRRNGRGWKPKIKVRLYSTSPAAFILRIDGRVFVEQYHYGKITREARAILGKDMPLFEYGQAPSSLYARESNDLRMPFGLLVNHLEYALDQGNDVDLNIYR